MAGRPKRAESTLAVSLGEFQRKEAAVEAARRGEIEASVRREVELQFRDKAGPVYRALEAEIRAPPQIAGSMASLALLGVGDLAPLRTLLDAGCACRPARHATPRRSASLADA